MDCPAAVERIREGRPLTVKDDQGNTTKCVADIVSVSTYTPSTRIHPIMHAHPLVNTNINTLSHTTLIELTQTT